MRIPSFFVLALALVGFADVAGAGVSPYALFKNSVRRDPVWHEAAAVVNVGGCTGFHVTNTAGKHFVMSARHCFKKQATQWCSNGGKFRKPDGEIGTCVRVVAGDTRHDIVLFEGAFPSPAQVTLSLASTPAPERARLQMIGYPADIYRKGKLTVTENCWVLQTNVRSPHADLLDTSSRHNCSTWGGNSGGPMILEESTVAIGLPFTYYPGNLNLHDAEMISTAAHLAQMSDFVQTFRTQLESEGVVLDEISSR